MIETARLILRQWREADRAGFAALNADPRVMEHFPKPLDRAESDAAAARIAAFIEANGFGFWAVERKADGELLGFTGLNAPAWAAPFTPCLEVGWRLAHAHWGRGYATEAARAALDFAFGRLGRDEVVAFAVPANRRSRAVMARLGMRHDPDGDFDHPLVPEGHALRRHVLYRLFRSEWQRGA